MTNFLFRISLFLLISPLSFPSLQAQQATDSALTSIAQFLDELGEQGQLSGVVLIAKDGNPVLEKAMGMAHVGYQIPNAPQTLFNFASMGKMFTGISILQLREQGLLALDGRVGQHLPEYPNPKVRDSVTIGFVDLSIQGHRVVGHSGGPFPGRRIGKSKAAV